MTGRSWNGANWEDVEVTPYLVTLRSGRAVRVLARDSREAIARAGTSEFPEVRVTEVTT